MDGDEAAFVAFVAARQQALVRAATLISGDAHLAQDLVQDALVKLALHWHRVGPGQPERYVRRILYRDLVSWRRRWRREALGDPPGVATADRTMQVDDRLELRAALARLTTKQRAVLILRFYEDLSVEQTADLLGVTTGTVKSQTHAALTALRAAHPAAVALNATLQKELTRDRT